MLHRLPLFVPPFDVLRRLLLIFLFYPGVCLSLLQAQTTTALPAAVETIITNSGIPAAEISLWVAPVDNGRPLVDWQSDLPRSPASSIKAVTTGIGLLLLGENFCWRMDFFTNGRVKNGVLNGDLFIKGYGDPYLVEEKLMDTVIELRERGIDRIAGKVVLDNTYFINRRENPDAFDGHGMEPYNALPNALSINFRTIDVLFTRQGNQVVVSTDPELTYVNIDNSMTMKRVLGDAGDVFFAYFKRAWELSGGSLNDDWLYGQVPQNAQLLYESCSRPLYEQIAAMNKFSNNIMTRQLFLTLGAELTRPPATLSKARAVVLHRLKKMGIDTKHLYIENGSGLSRTTRITAKQMGQFLLAMQDPRVAAMFEQSLSVAGVDGTLKQRLKNTPLAGNAIGKTGTLNEVKSLVGYLSAQSGRKYAYVILLEGSRAKAGRPLMDELLQWIYRQ